MSRKKSEMLQPLTEEQRQLAAQHWPFARSIVKRYAERYSWELHDDFQSAANYALLCCTRDFDPLRGIKFITFMSYRVNGALKDVLARYSRDELVIMDGNNLTIYDRDEAVGWEFNSLDSIDAILKGLSSKEKRIIELVFVYGKSQVEIAQSLRCSQAEVHRSYWKGINYLRYKISTDESQLKPRSKRKKEEPCLC